MKITRRQLRKLIIETLYGTGKRGHSKTRPEDPMRHVDKDIRKDLDQLITGDHVDDYEFKRQGHELATTLQRDMTVFPFEGDPYTTKPYEGDDYLEDLFKSLPYSIKPAPQSLLRKYKNAYDAYDANPTQATEDDFIAVGEEMSAYAIKVADALGLPRNPVHGYPDDLDKVYVRLFGSVLRAPPED
jgi:hypothetical protein